MDSTLQIIFNKIKEIADPPQRLRGGMSPEEAGLDSLSFVALTVALEQYTGVVTDGEMSDIYRCTSLRQLADDIDKKRAQQREKSAEAAGD